MKTKPKLLLRSETVFRKNIQRVYNLCVKCPIPDLKEFLTYPPNVIVPKHFIDAESVSSELFTRDAQCAADLLQQPYLSNGAASFCNKQSPSKGSGKKFLLSFILKSVLMVVVITMMDRMMRKSQVIVKIMKVDVKRTLIWTRTDLTYSGTLLNFKDSIDSINAIIVVFLYINIVIFHSVLKKNKS
jgi:hypothetical protein